MPLKTRLIATVLILNCMVALIIGISLQHSKRYHEDQAAVTTRNIAEVLDENISGVFEKIDLALLAVADEAERQMTSGGMRALDLNSFLLREQSRLPEVIFLRATDVEGAAIYGPALTPETSIARARPDYFLSLRDGSRRGLVISKPLETGVPGQQMIVLARRVNRPDGSFAGVVHAGVAIDFLSKYFSRLNVGPHGSIALFSSDLELVARHPVIASVGGVQPKARIPQFTEGVAEGKMSGTYTAWSSFDNTERCFTYRKLKGSPPLYVVVGLATTDFLATWRAEVVQMIFFLALFIAMTAALTWFALREWERNKSAQYEILRAEHRFRVFIENVDDYVFSISQKGEFSYVAPNIISNFGYQPAEIIGKEFHDFVHPDDVAGCVAVFQGVLATGEHRRDVEYRIRNKAGEWTWFSANVSVLVDGETGEANFFGIGRNITEKREALKALEESEARFKNLLQYIPSVAVQGYASDGTTQYWNSASEQLYGYAAHEAIGRSLLDLIIPPEMRVDVTRAIQAMAETGEAIPSSELTLMRKDGSLVPVFSSHVMVKVPGRPQELFCIDIDLTEQKNWAKQVLELNQTLDRRVKERTAQLELALKEQESFSYSVSHDLRSPLRHINSYLAILVEDFGASLSDEARGYVERSRTASCTMGKLIDDLLEFSRIGRAELLRESVDLAGIARDIVRELEEAEPDREVESVIADGLEATGDRVLLKLVLENLILNAWKYSSRSKSLRLEFGKSGTGGDTIFFLKDNGIGFQMEYHDKIFGVFQRLHGREYDGTGIGLATVKRILERHGGTIWAQAEQGVGATFYFRIPPGGRE